jgi:hypothetical protein
VVWCGVVRQVLVLFQEDLLRNTLRALRQVPPLAYLAPK